MKLSPHFTLAEMTRTSSSLPNKPSEKEIVALKALCENILEPIRIHFAKPVIVNSGYRSAAVNKAIGGAKTSQHLKGEAADIEIRGVSNAAIFRYIHENLDFDQVIAEKLRNDDGSAGWVHVSYSKYGLRGEALSFLGAGRYVKGLQFV